MCAKAACRPSRVVNAVWFWNRRAFAVAVLKESLVGLEALRTLDWFDVERLDRWFCRRAFQCAPKVRLRGTLGV